MSSDDNDKSTEQVLQYYQKYSQNRNLPKYFSGTSVSYLPPIVVENDDEKASKNVDRSAILSGSRIKPRQVCEVKITVDEAKNTSPNASSSESPSEHKKLEWDNGADIGYKSARRNSEKKLQKSSSLPILDSLKELASNLNVPATLAPTTIIAHSTSSENIGVIVFSSASTSDNESPKNNNKRHDVISSSSVTTSNQKDNQKEHPISTVTSTPSDLTNNKVNTQSDSDETRFVEFQMTIDYLKKKIGLPGAHSTPNVLDNIVTDFGDKESSKSSVAALLSKNLSSKGTSQEKMGSGSSMSNTVSGSFIAEVGKPSSHNKLTKKSSSSKSSSGSSPKPQPKRTKRRVETKIVELSISTPINVNCKGLNIGPREKDVQPLNAAVQTESIRRHHIETQFNYEPEDSGQKRRQRAVTKPNSVSASEDLADSASSFEYISVSKHMATKNSEAAVSVQHLLVDKATSISGVLKEIALTKNSTESSNLSRTSSEDIDKHLEVLHKLLRTKRMNSSTKKNYIKKLLKELNELESSDSTSTSSDLFIPKKDKEKDRPKPKLKSKVVFKQTEELISSFKAGRIKNHCLCLGEGDNEFQGDMKVLYEDDCVSEHSTSPDVESESVAEGNIAKSPDREDAIEEEISNSDPSKQHDSSLDLREGNIQSVGLSKTSSSEKKLTFCSESFSSGLKNNKGSEGSKMFSRAPPSSEVNDEIASTSSKMQEGTTQVSKIFLQDQGGQTLNTYLHRNIGTVSTASKSVSKDSTVKTNTPTELSKKCSDDYLLRFAENERTYQLHWINNEINHLSKLKSILELKSGRPSQTERTSSSTTNFYSVAQKDGPVKSFERNYVIQTKVDVPADQNINYILDGKEYVVSDSQKSTSSDSDKAVIADIEINSGEKQVNIKVQSLCSVCRQVACVCPSDKTMQSKYSSLCTEMEGLKVCSNCQQALCICQKVEEANKAECNIEKESFDKQCFTETSNGTKMKESVHVDSESDKASSQSSGPEVVSQSNFNYLQKIFEKCSCTIENSNCGCGFVKKMLDKYQQKHGQTSEAIQTDTLSRNKSSSVEPKKTHIMNSASQTYKLSQETKIQTSILPTQDSELQTGPNDKHISLQTLRDVLCKSTQTPGSDVNGPIVQIDQKQQSVHSQVSSSQSSVNTQTFRKRSRDDPVQAHIDSEDASLQATKPVLSNNVQTDDIARKDGASSFSTSEEDGKVGKQRKRSLVSSEESATGLRKGTIAEEPLKKISEEVLPEEKGTMTATKSSRSRNIGIQVLPSFDNIGSQSSVRVLHKIVQAEEKTDVTDKAVEKNGSTEERVPEKDGKTTEDVAVRTECTKCKERSKKNATVVSQSQGGSTFRSIPVSSESTSSASTRITCFCCKQKAFLAEVSYLQEGNDSLAVCSRCYYNRPRYCRHNPRFMCRCWTYWYARQNMDTEQYCKCCRIEISKCPKRPQGLAYTVTLPKDGSVKRRRRSSKSSMENIKVQKGWSWKSLKNQENYYKKEDSSGRERRKKEVNDEDKDEMEKDKYKKKLKKEDRKGSKDLDKDDDTQYTLPEYLIRNRPEFICAAEYRRQMLLNSRILREQQRDALKLNFLENNLRNLNEGKYKLFTEREMKDINKKNYKKLPEVQDKLINQRENRLRHADRLISDVFAKKVQNAVLHGKDSFPIDKPLTDL